MLFHSAIPLAASGFAGVDVFFVLSGFLITRLLLDEYARNGHIALTAFYMRRALRLLPALVTVCGFVLVVGLTAQQQARAVVAGVLASLLYVANIWIYSGHDTILLQHAWTLALEEQFYLLWPPLLILLLTVGRRRALALLVGMLGVLAILALAPLGEHSAGVQHNYLRATGLILGCAVGWLTTRRKIRVPPALSWGCLLAISILLLGPWHVPLPLLTSGYSFVAVLTVPVLIAITQQGEAFGILDSRPATWIGRRSYGLYLWHFPIMSLALHQAPENIPTAARVTAGLLASAVIAALSYRFVEVPFLRRKRRFERV
jgi:peptidoglycan/LPS O-acetylase OafA/YrhL